MILLDTNVISEALKPQPHAAVQDWFNAQTYDALYISSVTLAELLFGVEALPTGKRKDLLGRAVEGVVHVFHGRILPFDEDAARHFAALAIQARARGRGLPTPDGYIGAIATSRGYSVATRDRAPFEAAGVPVIDPWKHPRPRK